MRLKFITIMLGSRIGSNAYLAFVETTPRWLCWDNDTHYLFATLGSGHKQPGAQQQNAIQCGKPIEGTTSVGFAMSRHSLVQPQAQQC